MGRLWMNFEWVAFCLAEELFHRIGPWPRHSVALQDGERGGSIWFFFQRSKEKAPFGSVLVPQCMGFELAISGESRSVVACTLQVCTTTLSVAYSDVERASAEQAAASSVAQYEN